MSRLYLGEGGGGLVAEHKRKEKRKIVIDSGSDCFKIDDTKRLFKETIHAYACVIMPWSLKFDIYRLMGVCVCAPKRIPFFGREKGQYHQYILINFRFSNKFP